MLPGPGHHEWVRAGRPGVVAANRLRIGGLAPEEAEEFYARGYLIEAEPQRDPEPGKTSIVIVTFNQLAYTRQCVESIGRFTDEPYELIFVDNASTDGTADYLQSLPGTELIRNGENRGFPAAVNQGLAMATGDQLLLLNNDTVVTTGWLRRMLRVLRDDPQIGLVGPCSNCVSGTQQVSAGYGDIAELDGFAWEFGKRYDRQTAESDRLIGFCLLIRRALLDAIGPLDERFGIGCFEDDDYCLRAIRAGFHARIALDAFVHHYGGRTFVGSGADFAGIMRENEGKFREKWRGDLQPPPSQGPSASIPAPAPAPMPTATTSKRAGSSLYKAVMAPSGGLLLQRKHIHLSLCMIVRDNARTIRPCLESIRPWVDEMVIVDTGSKDETPKIALDYGACLFHFPWCDDFSAARNVSVDHARGQWIFWMDSDDTIAWETGRRLRALAYGDTNPSVLGYVMQVHCPGHGDDGAQDITAVDHVKLFRNRPDLRFDGRIHEQILPAIRRANGDVAWTDLYVTHSGSDQSPKAQDRKRERDLRILNLELRERPNHPFTLFNLGMTYADAGKYEPAVEFLKRGIEQSTPGESHLRKAYALLMYAQMQLKRRDDALATCERGRVLFPEDLELRFREGVLQHDLGNLAAAERAYLDVFDNHEERHFSSVDRGLRGFKARQNLAVVYLDMGELGKAERQWRQVVRDEPGYRAGWRGLTDILIKRDKLAEAGAIADEMAADPGRRTEGLLVKARLAKLRGDWNGARAGYHQVLAEFPGDLDAMRDRSQFLFEHGPIGEAERALRDLIARDPEDAANHHNLGTLFLREKRYPEATAAYRQSVRHRPDYAATHLQLGYALKESRRIEDAVAAWETVLRLEPDNQAAREEIERVMAVGAR